MGRFIDILQVIVVTIVIVTVEKIIDDFGESVEHGKCVFQSKQKEQYLGEAGI